MRPELHPGPPGRFRWAGVALIMAVAIIGALGLIVIGRIGAADGLAPATTIAAGLLVAGLAPAVYRYIRHRRDPAISWTIAAVLVNVAWAALVVAPLADRAKIVPAIAEAIRRSSAPAPVFAYEFAEPSLVFYGGRPMVELVGAPAVVEWAQRPGEALLVAPRESIAAVERVHGALGLREIAARHGWNYPNGRRLEVVAFVRPGAR